LAGIFVTGARSGAVWDTLGLTTSITNEGSRAILLQDLVVVTIGKNHENFGGISSDTVVVGSGQHVSTVDDTRGDTGTRTAARTRRNTASKDDALGVSSALQSGSSGSYGINVVTLGQSDRTIPSVGVKVGNTEIDGERAVGESSYQVLGKLLLENEFSVGDRRRTIQNEDDIDGLSTRAIIGGGTVSSAGSVSRTVTVGKGFSSNKSGGLRITLSVEGHRLEETGRVDRDKSSSRGGQVSRALINYGLSVFKRFDFTTTRVGEGIFVLRFGIGVTVTTIELI
jgi:hypothetical protein